MSVRTSKAQWNGSLKDGGGQMSLGSGLFEGPYSFPSRFEDGDGTNPEELIAAAHAGCYSMALSAGLGRAGHAPKRVVTTAKVHLEKVEDTGPTITKIELICEAEVPGISEEDFQEQAKAAKEGCPVSRALAGPEITLEATLIGG